MTTNFHTAIANGAPANSVTVEGPLSALDSAITNLLAGSQSFTQIMFGTPTTLTLATDAVTASRTRHLIDTEAAAASDNLSTISGGSDGDLLIIQAVSAARVVTVKHNVGNIFLAHEADLVLYDPKKTVALVYDATSSKWLELDASDIAFRTTINATLQPARKIVVPDGTLSSQGNDQVTLAVMPRPDVRNHFMAKASSNVMKGVGIADPAPNGTITVSNQTDSSYVNIAEAAATSGTSGKEDSSTMDLVRPGWQPTFYALIRTGPNAADIQNIRIWVGLFTLATGLNVDTLATNGLAFRFSTVVPDTNWQGAVCNGATQSIVNTGVVVASATVYLLRIRYDPVGLIAYFSVNGSAEVSLNTNLPANTADMGFSVAQITQAAAVKNLLLSRVYCDYN